MSRKFAVLYSHYAHVSRLENRVVFYQLTDLKEEPYINHPTVMESMKFDFSRLHVIRGARTFEDEKSPNDLLKRYVHEEAWKEQYGHDRYKGALLKEESLEALEQDLFGIDGRGDRIILMLSEKSVGRSVNLHILGAYNIGVSPDEHDMIFLLEQLFDSSDILGARTIKQESSASETLGSLQVDIESAFWAHDPSFSSPVTRAYITKKQANLLIERYFAKP